MEKTKTNYFINSNDVENSRKMDIEIAHNTNHSKMVQNYIFAKRINSNFPFNQKIQNSNNIMPDKFNSNMVVKNIEEILIIFYKIENITPFNQKKETYVIKNTLLEKLKEIRKELSKENISMEETKSIFNDNSQNFICGLLCKDLFDSYMQVESLWIINNFMFLAAKYKYCISFDVKNISNILIQYFINIIKSQKNEGVKYTLEEKILRIFGNIIYINNNVIELLINNNIITSIVDSLNSPVSSFRITCLWVINKIIVNLKKLEGINYMNLFYTKNAILNYKFILSRLDNLSSFDEIGELFWLFNELVKYDPTFLAIVFFSDLGDKNNDNEIRLNKELALKNYELVLNNCLSNKMFQTSFRLISNLLIVCFNIVKNEDLSSELINILFEKQGFIRFIDDVLNSPKNKYETPLVKDILLLIFNLICLSKIKSSILFKKGIINLINDINYQNDNEIMKLLLFMYYRILAANAFLFEPNDEKVIKVCLILLERFKDDISIIIIFIDIFYFYLKASHIKISDDIENEIKAMASCEQNTQNIPIEKYQFVLIKLTNSIKLHSPLSVFMKNI